jgi:hypothetical protein
MNETLTATFRDLYDREAALDRDFCAAVRDEAASRGLELSYEEAYRNRSLARARTLLNEVVTYDARTQLAKYPQR